MLMDKTVQKENSFFFIVALGSLLDLFFQGSRSSHFVLGF